MQTVELAVLYRLTDSLYRARSVGDAYEAALDAIVAVLGSRASILLFDDAGAMRFVAWRGLSDKYRSALVGHSPWKKGDTEAHPLFIEDIDKTDEPDWIKAAIRAEGIRGLGFIPIMSKGEVIGKFMTYYPDSHAFTSAEGELAITIARQLAFGLERANAAAAHQRAEDELRESEARFRLMSELAPVMIWTSDAQGHCLHLNRMLRRFWGVPDEADLSTFDWQKTMHPDDAADIGSAMFAATRDQKDVTIEGRYRNAESKYRILQTNARPRFSAGGTFLGLIGVNVDVSESREAEKALRESEERFRLAVEAAPNGMVMVDASGRITLVNAVAEELFGYERDELLGLSVEMLVPSALQPTQPGLPGQYLDQTLARPTGAGRDLFAHRKDGAEIPVEIGLSPIATDEGRFVLAGIVDISERKRADAQRELLIAELNHRVKNTLAVVQALAHQSFRGSAIIDAEARSAFEGRLVALATAHNLLATSDWQAASLRKLIADAARSMGVDEARISIEGTDVNLPAKHALSISLALHELCTNARKYGALSADEGKVGINWVVQAAPSPRLEFVWQEFDGPLVSDPTKRGFGSRLIEDALARDLDADVALEFAPAGVVCRVSAPLPPSTSTKQ